MAKITFGEKLKHLRKAAGLSQDQLSKGSGINLRTIHTYEYGQRAPSAENLFKLSEALGADCSVFKDCVFEREMQPAPAEEKAKAKPKGKGRKST